MESTLIQTNTWTDGVLTRGAFGGLGGDGNMSDLCPNGTRWVWEGLKECAMDGRDMASVYLGLFSILCFIMSTMPQYYSSCKTGNMDSALSIWFLLLWLGGDSCNLIGSFLADQLPLQTYTAVYYVLADLVMLAMYCYYKTRNMDHTSDSRILNVVAAVCVLGFGANFALLPGPLHLQNEASAAFKGRALLSVSDSSTSTFGFQVKTFTTKEIIGFAIGSVSSVLYLCSRLPQMYTNYKRRSTEGVSYFLFALVILGNTTYGLSVLLKEPDDNLGEGSYIIHHLPWLIGSLGTLTLDIMISFQFIIYRKRPEQEYGSCNETSPLLA